MDLEFKKILEEKIDIVIRETIIELDSNIQTMHANHASVGWLRSGNTISRTIHYICHGNEKIYESIISFVKNTPIEYYPNLSEHIIEIVKKKHERYNSGCKNVLLNSFEISTLSSNHDEFILKLKGKMHIHFNKFVNELKTIEFSLKKSCNQEEIKSKNKYFKFKKILELIMYLPLVIIIFLWCLDPEGPFEPYVVLLTFLIPLTPKFYSFYKLISGKIKR
ncbi:hypothetical protein [Veronia pacifica]|uniref:Uncharacterized protein n=1 Tax=Veronia pacifica TaxID=1080227 RepID=A0A1C3EL87_9GAMM|nr:hypothetical protein [Veronia pacifica]ODA34007.1 hypothetical protein A8L45_08145 [Veronia pacifica]